MHSTRLPGKMLLRETGVSLLEHTHRAASRAKRPAAVIVATDHHEIAEETRRFGGVAIMTRHDHASGGDRVAEVAERTPGYEFFVNVQGDEPEVDPDAIDLLCDLIASDESAAVATLAAPLREPERIRDPSNVKVVFDNAGRALYFSRSAIPFVRDDAAAGAEAEPLFHHHLGVYAYRREFLLRMPGLPASPLERVEKLEQLRFLQAGETIRVGVVPRAAAGIDTPAEYAQFVRRYSRRQAA